MVDWKTCQHTWGPRTDVRDENFDVKFGESATCTKCGARLYDDCGAQRVGNGKHIYPPDTEKG